MTWLLEVATAVVLDGGEGGVVSGVVDPTVTVTEAETDPAVFEAVKVYVVVAAGETETEPLLGITVPGAGVIVSVVAPPVSHDKEVD